MKLSRRVVGYVSAVMCALSLILIVSAAFLSLNDANGTDHATADGEKRRAQLAIRDRATALGRNATEWAAWDDTYQYVQNRNRLYLESNLSPQTLANLNINVLGIYSKLGHPINVLGYDLDGDMESVVPGADRLLLANPALGLSDGGATTTSGIVGLPDGRLLLVGSAVITPSAKDSPPVGTLVMGRFLDDAEVALIERGQQIRLATQGSGAASPASVAGSVRILDKTIQTTTPLRDVAGRPIGTLTISTPRSAYGETTRSLIYLAAGIGTLILVTVLIINWGLHRIVIDRVSRLGDYVEHVRVHGSAEPVREAVHDELGKLNTNIVEMVATLDLARIDTERKVEELSEALAEVRSQMNRRHAAEAARDESENRYRLLIDNMQDAVFVLGSSAVVNFASPSVKKLLGRDPEPIVGTPLHSLLDQDSGELLDRQIARGLSTSGTKLTVKALDHELQPMDAELILTPFGGNTGQIQAILRDITARKQHENELIHMASHDFLTGLANRRHFERELERDLAHTQRRGTHGAILWLDLDNFKDVNDTLGHRVGDQMLIEVAGRLASTVRAESLLARLGGDEFAVLLPGADEVEAIGAAKRLLREVSEVVLHAEGRIARASTSIGIVLYPEHGEDVDELLSHADVAMYGAKEMGRSRFRVFEANEQWRDQIEDRRVWTEMVELALAEEQFVVYAQPIVDTGSGHIVAYELLVRMDYQGDIIIPPDRFLPIAERVGLIVDIDLWVLAQAVDILAAHPEADFKLNVNVSTRTLCDTRFLRELEELVGSGDIDAGRLTIEITETAIIVDVAGVQDALRRIKSLGCRIALDDFGSGFTSFLHLRQLPVDDIKIDGAFVQNLCEDTNDRHLVLAMVEMARGLNMRTTAEFVESAEVLQMLQSFGVDMAQGYQVARPGPAHALIKLREGAGQRDPLASHREAPEPA